MPAIAARTRGRPPVRGAFTLIELLVVVAIIAVLAGMLMPALAMVQRAARNAACQSNLRQVFLAYNGYAADWEGRLPRGWSGGVELATSGDGQPYFTQYSALSEAPCIAANAWQHNPEPTVCPLMRRINQRNAGEPYPCYASPTYAPNLGAWNAGSRWGQPRTAHLPAGCSPAQLPLLVEARPPRGGCWDSPVANYVVFNHGGRGNAVCFDGHVAAFSAAQGTTAMVDGQL